MNSFLKNNVFSISFGTSLSKLAGCLRQILIAAAFGVGVTYDAFNYAYIIPGFLLIIIGGINGPLHNAVVAVLTPLDKKNGGIVLTQVSIKLSILLLFLAVLVYFNSGLLIELLAPNISNAAKVIATYQLKILTPCIPLSGFIGLSFGALNSRRRFFLSSISPAITSLSIIFFILFSLSFNQENTSSNLLAKTGLLAFATLIGTFIQFVIQIWEINKIGLLRLDSSFNSFIDEERRIFKLIIPASISSGLSQINVFIDMFFASSFQGAASGLAYGNFLVQAPLGILSNSLILPLLPKFSKLRSDKDDRGLKKKLISGIELCFLTSIFLAGFFITFNNQIVQLVFQRGSFDYSAASQVKKILIAYAVGIPFYLYRDLLVRTYYSIEKTNFPFKSSFAGIIFNIFFDWFLIGGPIKNFGNLSPYNFGVVGIILSSVIVNFIVCILLSFNLRNEDIHLPNLDLFRKISLMSLAAFIDSTFCFTILKTMNNSNSNLGEFLLLIFGSLTFFVIYYLLTKYFKVNKY
ncbi:murein biosynthesis integral membrane protein MurJ [Prochlorococcus marinus]|uniref:murein biosynthesis integral membrane protein MurJ n=1 Tax=Prochlorococcus marinus TaxID=1219 RepID=UPI001ADB1D25|nr:murein biosynthesis integral membrane protein MurJ [Prochlorococcus marinus]MBO8220334.1 murein biosynthesis integral membrane protein MurJ [Prochlorococcus marinus CUG1417]MBW3074967.1 murein biosynthesis integral membrane protein MurJ [Prochlorococcus marinus str. MU1417]